MMPEPKTIAGHLFEGAGSDRRCVKLKSDGSVCGKYWDDIKHVKRGDDSGKYGIAHTDPSNEAECGEIEEEVKRLDNLFGPGGYKS